MPEVEWQRRSQELVTQIQAFLKKRSFDRYILYRSFRREPDLSTLAACLPSEACYYPRIRGHEMDFYSTAGDFESNRFGIEEPPGIPQKMLRDFDPKTLLIIPAIAYDRRGFRLGYGGGFFDRFLSQHQLSTLGVCFDAFLKDELPTEAHDQAVSTVVTESQQILLQ